MPFDAEDRPPSPPLVRELSRRSCPARGRRVRARRANRSSIAASPAAATRGATSARPSSRGSRRRPDRHLCTAANICPGWRWSRIARAEVSLPTPSELGANCSSPAAASARAGFRLGVRHRPERKGGRTAPARPFARPPASGDRLRRRGHRPRRAAPHVLGRGTRPPARRDGTTFADGATAIPPAPGHTGEVATSLRVLVLVSIATATPAGAIATESMSPRPCQGSDCRSLQPSASRWTTVEAQPDGHQEQQPGERRRSRARAHESEQRRDGAGQRRLAGVGEPTVLLAARVAHAATASSSQPAPSALSHSVGSAIARSSHRCETVLAASGREPS